MNRHGIVIEDTFAEAFGMQATRVIITAPEPRWAREAAVSMTGFATSVIGCGVEAGIETELAPEATPDGRPGVSVLLFGMSTKAIGKQLEKRVGQCVLTSPGSAVYAGMSAGERVDLGRKLRYFGDGHQISKLIGARRYWRLPVMDGEFICEESTACTAAVGGGNFLVLARSQRQALRACERAVAAMRRLENVILPFPGGIVRSGSKVGSKYPALPASTNHLYCPTLRGVTDSRLAPEIGAVLEIVVNGLSDEDVRRALRVGIESACAAGRESGVERISAGNYGGKLGKFHFPLHEVMA